MTWHQHAAIIFLAELGKLWCNLLANWSFPQEGSWFWEGTCHLCVHNSNFKYKHMLQCTKAGWKITCVSSGKFLDPMPEMGMKFKHLGVMARLELGFLIPVNPKHAWKSWNLAWCHDMAPTCCGNFFARIGTSFGVSFLQTRASLKKARGSEREGITSMCETRYVHGLLPP